MTKAIITKEYTCYGGDHDRVLYLDLGVRGNVQLCLTFGGSAVCKHLTSDEDYRDWLYLHVKSLFIIDKTNWYSAVDKGDSRDFHQEFHYILKKIAEPVKD
jgi:hypothetical protein